MRKVLNIAVSAIAVVFTLWYMHFGSLTENNGAFSVTGLSHPVYFTIWGILTFCGIFGNLFFAYKRFLPNCNFQYILFVISAVGMILTLAFDFDYSLYVQYILHCMGSLLFSISTAAGVFLLFFLNFSKSKMFKIFTYIIGAVLMIDLGMLLIFKETALIEAVPVLFALIILPVLNFTSFFKEKEYASR